MGRRADHGRDELTGLILAAGEAVMAEGGYARFSAREVAKRIGYSVGTVMHLFANVDCLVMAINARTFARWTRSLEEALDGIGGRDRIVALVRGYFDFAIAHRNLWSAIYEHRVPEGIAMAPALADERTRLTELIAREVAVVLPDRPTEETAGLTGSLIATVHGHCAFLLGGSFALMGVERPVDLAVSRVLESLHAHGAGDHAAV